MKARQMALRLHLYLGLAAAVVIFMEGLTGAVVVFVPQLNHLVERGPKVVVTSQGPVLPYATLFAKLEAAYPDYPLRRVLPAADTKGAQPWSATMAAPWPWSDVSVAFDPHTGAILHDSRSDPQGLRATLLHAVFWFAALHGGLFSDSFLGCASIAFLIVSITGLLLWWPYALFWPRSRRLFDLHATIGFYSSLLIAVFSFTAITMVWPGLFAPAAAATPSVEPSAQAGHAPTPDELVHLALAAVPGRRILNIVPARGGGPFLVVIVTADGVADVSLDAKTGRILDLGLPLAPGPGRSFLETMRRIHTAKLFGLSSQLIAAAAGLAMAVLAASGPLLWWTRWRIKRRRRLMALKQP